MAAKVLPDQAFLRECFDYHPAVGFLVWRVRPDHHFKKIADAQTWNTKNAGRPAGRTRKDGRTVIMLAGGLWLASRLIWKMHHGTDPAEIDHRDNDASNDRLENLRAATQFENMRNSRRHRDNQSGAKGVWKIQKNGRYAAQIRVDGKTRHLGCFDTPKEAGAAYVAAARLHFGEFANGG